MTMYLHRGERGMHNSMHEQMSLSTSIIFHFHSYHNDHVVRSISYFNFSTKDMNRVALLLNVHKIQQVSSRLRKIMQKKIWESEQFKPDD
jgi:hypothetical protein